MRTDGEAEDMGRKEGDGWLDRMDSERPAAEKELAPSDAFRPHRGDESDLNILGADLLADPDPAFDPFRQKDAPTADTAAAQDQPKTDTPPPDAAPADQSLTGKSLRDAVAHTYAGSAPGRAHWRSSVAHAVDATYGAPDPDVVVKSTRSLIETVYGQGGDEDQGARDLS